MLQIFEDHAITPVGHPAVARSAVWTALIHVSMLLFLLSLGLSPVIDVLPDHLNLTMITAPMPPPPPPPAISRAATAAVRTAPRTFNAAVVAPVAIPKEVAILNTMEGAAPDLGVVGGVPGGIPGGILTGAVGNLAAAVQPPPPPPPATKIVQAAPPPPPPPSRIQVSADVQEAKLLTMVKPVYPQAAKMARLTGTVRLHAIIDRQGNISELETVAGHPMLVAAARAAVEKWRYQPTILNGQAVEVATDIIVNFRFL